MRGLVGAEGGAARRCCRRREVSCGWKRGQSREPSPELVRCLAEFVPEWSQPSCRREGGDSTRAPPLELLPQHPLNDGAGSKYHRQQRVSLVRSYTASPADLGPRPTAGVSSRRTSPILSAQLSQSMPLSPATPPSHLGPEPSYRLSWSKRRRGIRRRGRG